MKFDENLITKLTEISNFLEQQTTLDESLHELAVMAAHILNVRNCSIMLLKDETPRSFRLRIFSNYGYLPEEAYQEAVKLNEGIAGYVAATGQALLIENIEDSKFSSAARHKDEKNKCFISAPIFKNNRVKGVINIHNPENGRCFDHEDLNLLRLVALLIGKSTQVIQLKNLLKSRYAQFAMAKEAETQIGSKIAPSLLDTDRMAKILAKTFYKELTKAGLNTDQIIGIATEILSLLSEKLKKHIHRQNRN
jgi:signal transduction protein with GAF and PtsI domain